MARPQGSRNALIRITYDDIGRLFGRARPACGFSADLHLLFDLGNAADATRAAAILAPHSEDPHLQQVVAELRGAGRRVVMALPGQAGGAEAMGCDEVLRQVDGQWRVEPR